MLTEQDLLNEIALCESQNHTYSNLEKLATLYVLYDHLYGSNESTNKDTTPSIQHSYSISRKNAESGVEVLPTFFDYVEAKNAYKIGDVPKDKVLRTFNALVFEIKEMFNLIYSNTDTEEEREILYALIEDLQRV
jgi:hypothetical protein